MDSHSRPWARGSKVQEQLLEAQRDKTNLTKDGDLESTQLAELSGNDQPVELEKAHGGNDQPVELEKAHGGTEEDRDGDEPTKTLLDAKQRRSSLNSSFSMVTTASSVSMASSPATLSSKSRHGPQVPSALKKIASRDIGEDEFNDNESPEEDSVRCASAVQQPEDEYVPSDEMVQVGILMPISLGKEGTWNNLVELLRSIAVTFVRRSGSLDGGSSDGDSSSSSEIAKVRTLQSDLQGHGHQQRVKLNLYTGIQMDKQIIVEDKVDEQIAEMVHRVWSPHKSAALDFTVTTIPLNFSPDTHPTSALVELTQRVYEMNSTGIEFFIVGLQPSMRFLSTHPEGKSVAEQVGEMFSYFARVSQTEMGVIGCCAFLDEDKPSTPSVLVLPRAHLDVFDGLLIPKEFIVDDHVQDFVFEIHFRFGVAHILRHARIVKAEDGEIPSRPRRKLRHPQLAAKWTGYGNIDVCVNKYREVMGIPIQPRKALDIVVPSYRTPKHVIERILNLSRPEESLAIRVIVICDNPLSEEALGVFREIEEQYAHDFACKMRVNEKNMGPGFTRNSGLMECVGDYVLFLDDDVLPNPGLLYEYDRLIRERPEAAGFIGRTALPLPQNPRTYGFLRSRIAFGWDFALAGTEHELSWCITANLCVKRQVTKPMVMFDPKTFPKGGGGEDVDFCIRLVEDHKVKLVPAPLAMVRHPWWDDGNPRLNHFVCWAKGDRPLIERHPQFAFWNIPDCVETMYFAFLLGPLAIFGIPFKALKISPVAWLTFLAAQPIGEVAYEVFSLSHADLIKEKGLIFALQTAFFTAVVSMCHEYGRFRGHVDRGIFFSSFCKHFDWYGGSQWRKDFQYQERIRLVKRTISRLATFALLRYMLTHGLTKASHAVDYVLDILVGQFIR